MKLNPGPNQQRKTVPQMTMREASALIRSVNSGKISKPALQNMAKNLAPHLAPVVANMMPGVPVNKIAQAYGVYKQISSSNPEIASTVKESITSVFKSSKGNTSQGSSYALSNAPNPRKVKLNSGIIPNVFARDFMSSVENSCAPMHCTCVTLQLPTVTANPLSSYITNSIIFDIQTLAQSNVGYDVGTGSSFTASNILSALNATIAALQCYYWYSSILSYESDTRNKNEAMESLRLNISSQQFNLVVQLGRRLQNTPCPPRILQWVKWMSSNYYSGDNQGSALIKICPQLTLVNGGDSVNITYLTNTINNLYNTSNNNVYSIMRNAIPQWRINTLYDVTPVPNFDKNFLTVFSNLPFGIWNGAAIVNYPKDKTGAVVTDLSDPIFYNSFDNKLDGVAFAMTSTFVTSTSCYVPGLVVPNAVGNSAAPFSSSRISWAMQGGVPGWYNSDGNTFLLASRLDTIQIPVTTAPNTVITPHLYGADKCENVNGSSLVQSAENSLDYLFNLQSIPRKGKISGLNKNVSGKY